MQAPVIKNSPARVIDIIKWADNYFSLNGFENPRIEIEWLLEEILNCKKVDLYLRYEEQLSLKQLNKLHTWMNRRIKKEPIQYIIGKCEFYGRSFIVNKDVFIPRAETETLINIVLSILGNIPGQNILDICTGSGSIAVTLAKELNKANISAIDISKKALEVAMINARRHKVDINFEQLDILKTTYNHKMDMLVCNPPYIPISEMGMLMEDIRLYEPEIALTDGNDGLLFYKRISKLAPTIVKPGGQIVLEVGLNQHPTLVKNIFGVKPFTDLQIISDLNGDPRILKASIN